MTALSRRWNIVFSVKSAQEQKGTKVFPFIVISCIDQKIMSYQIERAIQFPLNIIDFILFSLHKKRHLKNNEMSRRLHFSTRLRIHRKKEDLAITFFLASSNGEKGRQNKRSDETIIICGNLIYIHLSWAQCINRALFISHHPSAFVASFCFTLFFSFFRQTTECFLLKRQRVENLCCLVAGVAFLRENEFNAVAVIQSTLAWFYLTRIANEFSPFSGVHYSHSRLITYK